MKLYYPLIIMVIVLPILIFANVWFSFQRYELEETISELQDKQSELIERNKRTITGISILRSPGRIIEEARKLGMREAEDKQIIRIQEEP